jgi:hypothetical protein
MSTPGRNGLIGLPGVRILGDVDVRRPSLGEGHELGRDQGVEAQLVDRVLVAHHGLDLGPPVPSRRGRFVSGTTGTTPSGFLIGNSPSPRRTEPSGSIPSGRRVGDGAAVER